MPDKESKILHRRLAEHRTNMEATLAGVKALARAERAHSAAGRSFGTSRRFSTGRPVVPSAKPV